MARHPRGHPRVVSALGAWLLVMAVVQPFGADRRRALTVRVVASGVALVAPDLGAAASISRLAAAMDDLYVIDTAPGHVRRYVLNGLPYAELFTQVMRWKEGADGLIMGKPLDLFVSAERLLILDSLGSLWSYWGPGYGRVLVPLRLQSNQGVPVAIALHGSRLLLLDPQRRQIWSYARDAAGGYDTTPRPLLSRPLALLAGAMRLAVSRNALLALLADGRIVVIPWSNPESAISPLLPFRVTGLWASAAGSRLLVSSSHAVAWLDTSGAVTWRVVLRGLGGQVIGDIARGPSGTIFVATRSRILRVLAPF